MKRRKYRGVRKIKLRYILPIILLMTIGYASINIVMNLSGKVKLAFDLNDFNVYILGVNDDNNDVTLNNDKQGFQANILKDSEVNYEIVNESTEYDVIAKIICTSGSTLIESEETRITAQDKATSSIILPTGKEYVCNLNIERLERTSKVAIDKDLMCNYGHEWIFDYNGTDGTDGSVQTFTAPCNGVYKLETWGAQGGSVNNGKGGYGGYSTGNITLNTNDNLYVIIGGNGLINKGGYNGGGSPSTCASLSYCGGGGGGATHISTISGLLKSLKQYKDTGGENKSNEILIVSGAGGGSYIGSGSTGGSGGGYIGGSGKFEDNRNLIIPGGTQTSGGSGNYQSGQFGLGGASSNEGAGGAGWYGGGGYNTSSGSGGAGGSGYIGNNLLSNKAMYCYDCEEATNIETDIDIFTVSTTGSTSYVDTTACPLGYSTNPISKCAKAGNGFARITYLGVQKTVTFDANGGTVSPSSKIVTVNRPYGELPTPTKDGYEFLGWNGKNLIEPNYYKKFRNYGTISDEFISIPGAVSSFLAHRLSLKANTNYTISLDFNGYTPTNAWRFGIYNETKEEYTELQMFGDVKNYPTIFTKTLVTGNNGYLYLGHLYGNADDRIPIYFDTVKIQLEEGSTATSYEPYYITDTTKVVQDTNHTLKAIWEPNTYEIVFDKNADEATGTMSNQSMVYDESNTLNSNSFERNGYTFDGWNTESDGSGTSYTNEQSVSNLVTTGTIKLYAQWNEI